MIRNLKDLSFDEIAEAFLDAFADYNVSFDKTALEAMFKRRGADLSLSFAALDNGKIVSFIFNGIGEFDGQPAAYDTGTGTIKEYRGQHLTDRIFEYSEPLLAQAGIKRYVLEVLKDNIPAVKIYSRLGFEVQRELVCYNGVNDVVKKNLSGSGVADLVIEKVPVESILPFTSFMDFTPSWQNSTESLLRNPKAFTSVVAYIDGKPAGYGVSETAFGDISQIAVAPEYRRMGVGSRILLELLNNVEIERSKALNIDASCEGMKRFLTNCGYEVSALQYEMVKPLS
ncbi:MAG: GNAT family N-acetyltransferase [Bacteroidales bacterium]|nr:GNAT family N-acetyltransferase [Bacteroidales bacterium]